MNLNRDTERERKVGRLWGLPLPVGGLALLALLATAGYVALWIALAANRLFYPFALEWTESGELAQVRWIAQGRAPYVPPSLHFIPTGKTPLFFYLSAAAMSLVGDGFVALRLISILSTLGCLFLLARIVFRETGRRLPGILAAGLYAASYRFAGAWTDLAKTDSLFMLLLLAGFLVGREADRRAREQGERAAAWGRVWSGLLFVAAYYTKQLALPIALVLAPTWLVVSRGRAWVQWATAAVVGTALFVALDAGTEGWFSFYTVETSLHHERTGGLLLFWRASLPHTWPALAASVLYPLGVLLAARTLGRQGRTVAQRVTAPPWSDLLLCLSLALGLVAASWAITLKAWTYDNAFILACAGLAALSGLGLGELVRTGPIRGKVGPALAAVSLLLILVQFARLAYSPLQQLPTRADRQAGEALVAYIRALDGPTWAFQHSYLGELAGQGTFVHSATLGDLVGAVRPPRTADFERRRELGLAVLRQAFEEQAFEWILADNPNVNYRPYYLHVERLFTDPEVFYTVTGAHTRPESLTRRNPVARGGDLAPNDPSWDLLFATGWSVAESWGRWAVGTQAALRLALEPGHNYRLQIELFPVCPPDHAAQEVTVYWNDERLGHTRMPDCDRRALAFDLPAAAVTGDLDTLQLQFAHAVSPSESGHSQDARELAAGVTRVSVEQR